MSGLPAVPNRFFIPALGMLSALVAMAMDMYLPSLPQIAIELATDFGQVQQTLSVFLIGIAVSQLFYGPISDRFGRRPVLLIGVCIFLVISIFCIFVNDIQQLIYLRLVQSLGAGAGSVIVLAMVRDLFEREQAARVMSYVIMVMMVVPLIAPILGGYLLHWFGWRSIFTVLAILGVLCALTVIWVIPETLPADRRQSLSATNLIGVYWRIFSNSKAMGLNLCAACSFGLMFAFITESPFVYIEYFGLAPQHYGYFFGCNIVMVMSLSYLNSRLLRSYSSHSLLFIGIVLQLAACVGLLLVSVFDWGGLLGTVMFVIPCIGMMGMVNANSSASALACFTEASGTVAGVIGISRFSAAGLASAAVGLLHNGSNLVMPAVMLLCSVLALISLTMLAKVRSWKT